MEMALVTDTVAAKARAATLETKPMLEIMHSATIGLVVAFGATAYKSCVTRVGGVVAGSKNKEREVKRCIIYTLEENSHYERDAPFGRIA
jgi:hypothetical protein